MLELRALSRGLQGQKLVDALAQPGSMQRVLQLHVEAFWSAHGRKVLAALGLLAVWGLWCAPALVLQPKLLLHSGWTGPQLAAACRRGMFRVTKSFMDLSESMAEYGFLVSLPALL